MIMLYQPERHQQLPPSDWNPERAKAWLDHFAQAALELKKQTGLWPLHPRDASDFGDQVLIPRLTSLYCGEAGVWLALARLAQAGYAQLPQPLADIYSELLQAYTSDPETGERVPSWFLGESSLLTARWLAQADRHIEDQLEAVIDANRQNPTREALWGAPGTMIGALFLWEQSHKERWADVYHKSVKAIWDSWHFDEASQIWLWEQDMYGRQTRYLGAGHGWAGNLYPLWRGYDLLSAEQQQILAERTISGLQQLIQVSPQGANWPALPGRLQNMLLQWCHGAPGMITSLRFAVSHLPDALPLLLQGGELIVQAGALNKGVSICHGTAGNGLALLELYRKTADPRWLEQARQFASWALQQSEHAFQRQGQWHYSLWTGDAGLACFLLDCLSGQPNGLPGLDAFWPGFYD